MVAGLTSSGRGADSLRLLMKVWDRRGRECQYNTGVRGSNSCSSSIGFLLSKSMRAQFLSRMLFIWGLTGQRRVVEYIPGRGRRGKALCIDPPFGEKTHSCLSGTAVGLFFYAVQGIRSSSVRFRAAARGRIFTRGTGLRPASHCRTATWALSPSYPSFSPSSRWV